VELVCEQNNAALNNLHGTECEDEAHGDLLLSVHLQSSNDEDWNDTKRPVGHTAQCRVSIERADDDIGRNAFSLTAPKLFPEERDRPALKCEEKQEKHAVQLNGDETDPEDDPVRALDGDSEQKDANAHFEKYIRDDISGFAGPPPLNRIL
jgi:hypothetical protein